MRVSVFCLLSFMYLFLPTKFSFFISFANRGVQFEVYWAELTIQQEFLRQKYFSIRSVMSVNSKLHPPQS